METGKPGRAGAFPTTGAPSPLQVPRHSEASVLVKGQFSASFMPVQVEMEARDKQCESGSPVVLLDPP